MATGWIITTLPRMRETQIAHALWSQINKLMVAGVTVRISHIAVSRDARLVAIVVVSPGVI
jgi:hypothetical protein